MLAALEGPAVEMPTGVSAGRAQLHDGLSLWLAMHEPRWCALTGRLEWAPVTAQGYGMTVGLAGPDGLAVLAAGEELLARGYGPAGAALAAELVAHVQAWDMEQHVDREREQRHRRHRLLRAQLEAQVLAQDRARRADHV